MTLATSHSEALEHYKDALIQWQAHHTSRTETEKELTELLAVDDKPANFSVRVPYLRERLEVLEWQINCAAREGVYCQRIVLEACAEDALNGFMGAHGPALTSALAPFLNSPGGLNVAVRMLRSAVAHQTQASRPEVAEIYRDTLNEAGLTAKAEMLRDCQQSYTAASHQRYQQRLSKLNDHPGGTSWH